MSTRFEAQPPNPVPLARGSVAAVMEAIGLEIAQWEKGGQSEAEARARIGALVSIGKDLIRTRAL